MPSVFCAVVTGIF